MIIWTMRIPFVILGLVFMLSGPPLSGNAEADDTLFAKPVVIIDAGHTNKMPGAMSITGKHEVEYNDNLASELADALTKAGFIPILTRKPNQEIKLEDRVAMANSYNALAILSIHHDSAQLEHLESTQQNGIKTYRTRKPISGYSIFVSKKNPQYINSYIFAKLLGHELLELGRKPSLHHAEPIHGEGRPLLDANLGIYQYDDLVVLKKPKIPAVLLEVGVIVDPLDEAYVTNSENQEAMVNALVVSISKFNTLKSGKP
jgi:N-acetylmuramoyl-L-alanine amidase